MISPDSSLQDMQEIIEIKNKPLSQCSSRVIYRRWRLVNMVQM